MGSSGLETASNSWDLGLNVGFYWKFAGRRGRRERERDLINWRGSATTCRCDLSASNQVIHETITATLPLYINNLLFILHIFSKKKLLGICFSNLSHILLYVYGSICYSYSSLTLGSKSQLSASFIF